MKTELYLGDCLVESDKIESGSIDLILSDLPFGTMDTEGGRRMNINGWDEVIPIAKINEIANRILRNNGKMVLFAQEPFTTNLINSAIPNIPFNYRAIWEKDNLANALGVSKNMVGFYEDILVFSKNHPKHDFEGFHPLRPYFKQIFEFIGETKKVIIETVGQRADHVFRFNSTQFSLCSEKTYLKLVQVFCINKMRGFRDFSELNCVNEKYRSDLIFKMNAEYPSTFNLWEGKKYKSNILKYKKDYDGFHPTQKPVLLLEDLIKTFSNENNLIVDLTMGSGSTGVACINTNRNFIGIEKDENYFKIASDRILKSELG